MGNYVVDTHDRILLYLLQGKANSYLSILAPGKSKFLSFAILAPGKSKFLSLIRPCGRGALSFSCFLDPGLPVIRYSVEIGATRLTAEPGNSIDLITLTKSGLSPSPLPRRQRFHGRESPRDAFEAPRGLIE